MSNKEMATTDENLVSTPRWAATLSARFAGGMLMWTLVILTFSSLSLYLVGLGFPEGIPFIWISIFSVALMMTGVEEEDQGGISVEEAIETLQTMTPWERRVYLASMTVIALGMVSVEVGAVGVLSAYIAHQFSLPLVAIAIAVIGPPIDAWLGRNLDISFGTIGLWAAVLLMSVVAYLVNTSTDVPRRAGDSMRQFAA